MPYDPDRPWLLWCAACGRSEKSSPDDLARHTREGWPRCCGRLMSYFTEVRRLDLDDTKTDLPALPTV